MQVDGARRRKSIPPMPSFIIDCRAGQLHLTLACFRRFLSLSASTRFNNRASVRLRVTSRLGFQSHRLLFLQKTLLMSANFFAAGTTREGREK
jgi:hypothetical protein